MAVDILIIRNRCDAATEGTYHIGEGLKAHLESKGCSVTDLPDTQASSENVTYWLNSTNNRTKKLIIGFDHGSCSAFYGEKNNSTEAVITKSNAQDLTQSLHMYTFACSTNGDGCVGQVALEKECYSWLGYTEPVYVFTDPNSSLFKKLKAVIWSYITALAEGKTLEQAEAILRTAYADNKNAHWLFDYNLKRLLLRKKASNMTINSHNRVVIWRPNVRVNSLYAHGPQNRNVFVHFVGLGWKRLWPDHDAQVVSMLAELASAKAKNRPVSFMEDDGRVKYIYA
ncbi:MAG: hypothetical protein QNJ36_12520 [Calothrix sp. MO_167.B42]|nr:hypothetical protein [Calothrix sp. MO_167.B42]